MKIYKLEKELKNNRAKLIKTFNVPCSNIGKKLKKINHVKFKKPIILMNDKGFSIEIKCKILKNKNGG